MLRHPKLFRCFQAATLFAAGSGAVLLSYEHLQPAPTAYLRSEVNEVDAVNTVNGAAAFVKDPKLEIKYGNGGIGPMWISHIALVGQHGDTKDLDPSTALTFSSSIVASNVFYGLLGAHTPALPWSGHGIITLATLRPVDKRSAAKSSEWEKQARADLQRNTLFLYVNYSWTSWSWWPKRSAWIELK